MAAINQKQVLKQLQKLSPQQIQTVKLLELPTMQLEQRVRQEIEENPVLEVYIDGFEGDLYGKKVRVEFDRKIRDIRKFASKEELKEQLERDIRTVR